MKNLLPPVLKRSPPTQCGRDPIVSYVLKVDGYVLSSYVGVGERDLQM
jgi:hypothetical protein